MASWMSLWAVVRLARPAAGRFDSSAGWARDDGLLPVSSVVPVGNDMDARRGVLGLGCSLTLFLRWRTLC